MSLIMTGPSIWISRISTSNNDPTLDRQGDPASDTVWIEARTSHQNKNNHAGCASSGNTTSERN